jgi:hypothetical protein
MILRIVVQVVLHDKLVQQGLLHVVLHLIIHLHEEGKWNIMIRELHSCVVILMRVILQLIKLVRIQHDRMMEDDGLVLMQICVLDDEQFVNVEDQRVNI